MYSVPEDFICFIKEENFIKEDTPPLILQSYLFHNLQGFMYSYVTKK